MRKIGFIGAGNMAGSIIQGVLCSGLLSASEMAICDVDESQCKKREEQHPGIWVAKDNVTLVEQCEWIVLAVKPVYLDGVLEEIKTHAAGKKFISVAAGWTVAMLSDYLGIASGARLLRVMPNTPAIVGEGYTALCDEHTLLKEDFDWVKMLFQTFGKTDVFPESLFDGVIAISGSSPAYAFMMIEAMADGGVKLGMPRDIAYRAAAQSMLGAAKMVLETGEHPAKLKDNVCSPGGTTIEAVHALEKHGFRNAVISAMQHCAKRSAELSKK